MSPRSIEPHGQPVAGVSTAGHPDTRRVDGWPCFWLRGALVAGRSQVRVLPEPFCADYEELGTIMRNSALAIQFTVPAVPIAQPRVRATVRGKHAAVYTPTNHPVNAFKALTRLVAHAAYSGPPFSGPLRVDVVFVFPRPKSKIWKTRPMPRYRHAKKPDRDNCDKAVLDALSGIWVDDAQVCDGRIEKWVASGYEQPHVEIRIEELGD